MITCLLYIPVCERFKTVYDRVETDKYLDEDEKYER